MDIVIVIIAMYVLNKITLKVINKEKDIVVKVLYGVCLIISDIFLVIYYTDRFNLPTFFKMNQNVDTQNWLNNISNLVSNILSATIGGIIAFGIARHEINANNKQNLENNRVQNMPMLKYNITTDVRGKEINRDNNIFTKYDNVNNSGSYDIFINIKNIGLNNVKRMIVDIQSECFINKDRAIGKDTQVPIEKGENIEIYRFFSLLKGKDYKMILNVYYEDVLQNWYLQEVEIKYTANDIYYSEGCIGQVSYIVKEENLINKEDIPK
jgi:hypothetical protein